MRKTKVDLERAVDNLNTRYKRKDQQWYSIDWAYNQPALVIEGAGFRTLSPRDTVGKTITWIDAFRQGLEEAGR